MKKNFSSSIFGASLILTIISIITKGFGFLREMIYAKEFGLGEDFNAFLVSSILPIIIYSTIYYLGQLYFIPAYHKILNSKGKEEAKVFFSQNTWGFFVLGWIIYFILFFFSNWIINVYLQNSSHEIKETALSIFRVFILTIPFASGHAVLAAHLNAESKFTFPAFSTMLMNVIIVILLFIFSSKVGILLIPFAFALGWASQFIYLFFISRQDIYLNPLIVFKKNPSVRLINSTLILTILVEVVTLSYSLVDRYFLGEVGEGGIASLSYAAALWEMPVKIISFALATVIFSKLSSAFSKSNLQELSKTFYQGIKITVFFFIPIAFIMYFWGDFIIELLYQRGRFSGRDTFITAEVLSIYALSLVFFSSYAIINKMLYSSGLVKFLFLISLIGLSIKIVLNISLVEQFNQNGLAFSSTISYSFLCVSGYYIAVKKNKFSNISQFAKSLFVSVLNGYLSFFTVTLLISVILEPGLFRDFISLIFFILIYFFNSYMINTDEFKVGVNMIKTTIAR